MTAHDIGWAIDNPPCKLWSITHADVLADDWEFACGCSETSRTTTAHPGR